MTAKSFDDLAAPLFATAEGRRRMDELRHEYEAEVFAHKIGELRQELGIDQKELADRLGMSQAGVSKLEKSADPKLSTLIKLTSALGATLHVEIASQDRRIALAPFLSLHERLERIRSMPNPQNEESAKVKIVLPILRDLGWDPCGQDVFFEYPIGAESSQRVDIALKVSERTVALIEVKAPKPNIGIYANQILSYASHVEPDICVLTNGLEWLLYLSDSEMSPGEGRFATISIKDEPIERTLQRLYAFLCREQLIGGQAREHAEQILADNQEMASFDEEVSPTRNNTSAPFKRSHTRKSESGIKRIVLFGQRHRVDSNRDVLMKVAEELYVRHSADFDKVLKCKESELPIIAREKEKRTLYRSNSKKNSSIRELMSQEESSGYYVFVGNSTRVNIRKRADLMLQAFDYEPSELIVLQD